jgi:hypothetical protein
MKDHALSLCLAQLQQGVFVRARFTQYFCVQQRTLIGTNDNRIRMIGCYLPCLRFRQSTNVTVGIFSWPESLVDIRSNAGEIELQSIQQLLAERRSAGQYYLSLHWV